MLNQYTYHMIEKLGSIERTKLGQVEKAYHDVCARPCKQLMIGLTTFFWPAA